MSGLASSLNRVFTRTLGVRLARPRDLALPEKWFARMLYFHTLFEQIEEVDGDVVECGVADGKSLGVLLALVRASQRERHVWGFDTFEGLPEPAQQDLTVGDRYAIPGMFKATPEVVTERLRWHDFSDDYIDKNVTLVKGLVGDTLPGYDGKIAFLHIDVDLYEGYWDCLRILWDKVSPGGIVAFDDYRRPEWPGATAAVDEFLATLPDGVATLRRGPIFYGGAAHDRYYVVKHRGRGS